jgi:hypothetical protein
MIQKEELQERAQLVRIHEANCKIEFPSPEEANFRIATMRALGRALNLRELRAQQIAGPVICTPPRPSGAVVPTASVQGRPAAARKV